MAQKNSIVLAVGGAGQFAGMVVPQLAERGAVVRALVLNEAQAQIARTNGAAQVAIGNLRDTASLDAAAEGVDGVFHIGPVFTADEAQLGINMVNAAKRAGARKFVFSSVIQPTNMELENHASKIPVESALFSSDMQYTILHPANLIQNFGGAWDAIVAKGVYAEPNPVDRKVARVDYRDVAEVAAIALTEDRLAYGSFELCSDDMLTRQEIADLASAALARPIEARQLGFDEWAAVAKLPYDERELTLLARIHAHLSRHGLGGNSLTLRAILGRPPRSMREYIQELAAKTRGAGSDTARVAA